MITAATASATAANRPAARQPSRTASMVPATTRAGQAVALVAAAMPSTSPAATGRGRRHSSARPRQTRASTGTSVPPTVRENAMTGLAMTSTVQRSTSRAPAAASAAANRPAKARPNQIRGSVTRPWPNSARGRPKTAITGR